jgi:cytochrome P450
MDVITYLCFGQDIDAANASNFEQPLIKAMSDSSSIVIYFKHFPIFRKLITSIPPERAMKSNPQIAGLLKMQQLLKQRIASHVDDPESLKELPHSTTIFNLLINPEVHKSKKVADALSIYEESQVMMFAGGDTTANVIMIGTFYLLKQPELTQRLKKELLEVWPILDEEP